MGTSPTVNYHKRPETFKKNSQNNAINKNLH